MFLSITKTMFLSKYYFYYSISSSPCLSLVVHNTKTCYALRFVTMFSNTTRMGCSNFCTIGGIEMISTTGFPVPVERNSSLAITWKTVPNNAFTCVSMLANSTRHSCSNFMSICCIEMIYFRCTPVAIERDRTMHSVSIKEYCDAFRYVIISSSVTMKDSSNFIWIDCVKMISTRTFPVAIECS